MNPWVMLAAVAALAGSYLYGLHQGKAINEAAHAKEAAVIQRVSEAAQQAAAVAISKIKVINQTNQSRLEREIVHVPGDCHAGADVKRVLDDQLTNKAGAEPASDSKLPSTDGTS